MNKQDENALTEAWHSDTNWLSAMREAAHGITKEQDTK